MRKFNFILLPALLALSLFTTACNGYDAATRVSGVVSAILTVASAETPNIPAADQAAYTGFVTLGQTLESQLQTCLAAADSGISKSAKFLACFNSFVVGLNSPAELAQLRILNPATQRKVELYLTGITVGLNVGIAAFGGTQATAPVVGPKPTTAELRDLRDTPQIQVALLDRYCQ